MDMVSSAFYPDRGLWQISLWNFRCGKFCMPLYFVRVLSRSHIPSFKIFPSSKWKIKINSLNLLPVNTHAIEKELHRLSFPAGMEQLYCSSDFLRASFSLQFPVFIYRAKGCLEKRKEKYYTSHDQLVLGGKVLLWSLRNKRRFQCQFWI